MAGSNLYWGHGEHALRELLERRGIPVFLNGLARGCVPADHELFFSRARRQGLREADVALVVGVPMDFRLGFGAVVRRGDRDRPASTAPSPSASRRARWRSSSTAASRRRSRR